MKIHYLVDMAYKTARKITGALGLMGIARQLLGPVIGRILYKLSPGGSGPIELNGNTMYLAPSGTYPPLAMAHDRYEPKTTLLFKETLRYGMVFIDIGAHVGYYTLLAAKLVGPTGKVYAFEPAPGNHDTLLKNIELNDYMNITATNMALSDQNSTATIYFSGLDTGRHSLYQHGLPEQGNAVVETTTLDNYLESQGQPNIDLIKIDVEGAEVSVLDGMSQLLLRSPNLKLIIEFNPALLQSAGVPPLKLLDTLRSLGFQLSNIDDSMGLSQVSEENYSQLMDHLLSSNNSINLLCAKR